MGRLSVAKKTDIQLNIFFQMTASIGKHSRMHSGIYKQKWYDVRSRVKADDSAQLESGVSSPYKQVFPSVGSLFIHN